MEFPTPPLWRRGGRYWEAAVTHYLPLVWFYWNCCPRVSSQRTPPHALTHTHSSSLFQCCYGLARVDMWSPCKNISQHLRYCQTIAYTYDIVLGDVHAYLSLATNLYFDMCVILGTHMGMWVTLPPKREKNLGKLTLIFFWISVIIKFKQNKYLREYVTSAFPAK